MCVLDISAPQSVFWTASRAMTKRGLDGYSCHTVSAGGGLVRSAEGVEINTRPFSDFDAISVDTVMIPGSFFMDVILPESSELLDWLRDVSARARRTTAACCGAFFLAEAGLLRDKRAATHWMMSDRFQVQFPDVRVDSESIFVRQGPIWTSAGVTACIDLTWALVEEDCGHVVAMTVAQELVVFLKRPGGQAQFSQLLRIQTQDGDEFDELHYWIVDNLANAALTVEMMAEHVFMSPRNFTRVYKKRTGNSPAKSLEQLRIEAARRMLEDSKYTISEIARLCGFGDEQRMRATFLRNLSVTPRDYRKRFSSRLTAFT
jgi:transcriptional regulator GlxA family with amidase domain